MILLKLVKDFVDITENLSSFDVEDVVKICKRRNNNKREYLFVNQYQGKHIPCSPSKIIEFFDNFVEILKQRLNPDERIMVVGFAETATGIAEYVSYKLKQDKKFSKSMVYHLQTSRERYPDSYKLFDFNEEHSHAVNQCIYSQKSLPYYDRVLFIEDEITTGKTILNFIEKFKDINAKCKYTVASFLNWQNEDCIEVYEANGIDRVFMISGRIKSDLPSLNDVVDDSFEDYFDLYLGQSVKVLDTNKILYLNMGNANSRLGVDSSIFKTQINATLNKVITQILSDITPNDIVDVIGTEEYMLYPLMVAHDIESSIGCKTTYHATTRSPIVISNCQDYCIKNGIKLNSFYDDRRETYLYNLNDDVTVYVVITDSRRIGDGLKGFSKYCKDKGKKVLFIEL